MATTNRLQVIIYGKELDIISAEDLGLSFQRIADDEADLSKRYGEFSYSFDVPITKNNSTIFQYANANGRKNIFNPNQDLPCQVFNNNQLLLDGVISLQGVTKSTFNCIFYSKLKEFSDIIADKTLNDLQFAPISWNYEKYIINHINADYQNSDETYWQFPFTYYGTYFTPYDTFKNKVDYRGVTFDIEAYAHQQFYYCMNSVNSNTNNRFYHHQLPPAFYIVSIMNQIFTDAGWSIGGQFWNQDNIKKIVMLYSGDDDLFDRAIAASSTAYDDAGGVLSTSGLTTPLYPAKLLPDMLQSDFINGVMNMFCLYPVVDVSNKIIKFSPFTEIFGNTFNPYDITKKVKLETVRFSYMENNNPTIRFQENENLRIMGDNTISSGNTTNATSMLWRTTTDVNHDKFFNHIGTTDEIELPFSAPTVKKTFIYNDVNINGTNMTADYHTIIHPLMSAQTPYEEKKFCGNTGQTYVFNNEGFLKLGDNAPTLHYYYGKSNSDFVNKTGKGYAKYFYYLNIYTGNTVNRVPITFCSPFQMNNFRDEIDAYSLAPESLDSLKTIATTYLRGIWNMLGKTNPDNNNVTTDYSLVFDSQGYFHNTLWDVFHKPKYDRYKYSEILEAEMVMNEYDWQEMQLSRAIQYNNEIYHIVSIENYNPIINNASVKLIKV